MSSIREVKALTPAVAYRRIKKHLAKADWQIIAFTAKYWIFRIGHENLKFDRGTGRILDRATLNSPRRER